eukprot:CAMPEP_0181351350 /NCGR_PEP_ID=MMETSP1106-20121128/1742_1 /TAXON_ID=81844 /ORGANISM="Mantoniella antarctica, Strain SL-175" /LENGTH=171 /DNA_ID=CAMNT_0023463863 /DNA_START=304 /DNA_END=815 /DNA_ORIENTATION=+
MEDVVEATPHPRPSPVDGACGCRGRCGRRAADTRGAGHTHILCVAMAKQDVANNDAMTRGMQCLDISTDSMPATRMDVIAPQASTVIAGQLLHKVTTKETPDLLVLALFCTGARLHPEAHGGAVGVTSKQDYLPIELSSILCTGTQGGGELMWLVAHPGVMGLSRFRRLRR